MFKKKGQALCLHNSEILQQNWKYREQIMIHDLYRSAWVAYKGAHFRRQQAIEMTITVGTSLIPMQALPTHFANCKWWKAGWCLERRLSRYHAVHFWLCSTMHSRLTIYNKVETESAAEDDYLMVIVWKRFLLKVAWIVELHLHQWQRRETVLTTPKKVFLPCNLTLSLDSRVE